MTESRLRDEWEHTSSILCMLANVNRDPKKSRPYKPAQFNPFLQSRRKKTPVSVERLTEEMTRLADRKRGRRR